MFNWVKSFFHKSFSFFFFWHWWEIVIGSLAKLLLLPSLKNLFSVIFIKISFHWTAMTDESFSVFSDDVWKPHVQHGLRNIRQFCDWFIFWKVFDDWKPEISTVEASSRNVWSRSLGTWKARILRLSQTNSLRTNIIFISYHPISTIFMIVYKSTKPIYQKAVFTFSGLVIESNYFYLRRQCFSIESNGNLFI